jgi:hypothetical protein
LRGVSSERATHGIGHFTHAPPPKHVFEILHSKSNALIEVAGQRLSSATARKASLRCA